MSALLAALSNDELSTVLVVLAILLLIGAGYATWIRQFPVAIGLAVLAVLCFFLAD